MPRYAAFISYSHADADVARWLHRALETYRFPRGLVGMPTPVGPVARRLAPIFRDREELPAAADLGDRLREALREARHLLVICSPRAARSPWVNEEIRFFKAHHGGERVLALIAAGEPGHAEEECFPAALRFRLDAAGQLSDAPAEPLAADIRPGKDGRRLARLKLLAGLSGLPLDQLARRDVARRQQRLVWLAAAASLVAVITAGLAIYANQQRVAADRARLLAEQQRRTAEASLDFLIGTYEIANPATENPGSISAVTILKRTSDRVRRELRTQPGVAARILRSTGDIYSNLGLAAEAERDLRAALALLPPEGAARAATLLRLAALQVRAAGYARAARTLAEARAAAALSAPDNVLLAAQAAELDGAIASGQFRSVEALDSLAQAAALYAAAGGDRAADLVRVYSQQGLVLFRDRRFTQADAALARAEQTARARYGPDHMLAANAMQFRAVGALEGGRVAEAEALADKVAAIHARVLDPDHPTVANAWVLRARIYAAAGRPHEARRAIDTAIAMHARLSGPTSARSGDALYTAAELALGQREPARAWQAANRALAAYVASYGEQDADVANALLLRARASAALGRTASAAADCGRATSLLQQADPDAVSDIIEQCAQLSDHDPG